MKEESYNELEDNRSSRSSFQCSKTVNSQNEFDLKLHSIEKSQKPGNYVQEMRLKFETISASNKFWKPRFPTKFRQWGNSSGIDEVPSDEEAGEIFGSEYESGSEVLEARNELISGVVTDQENVEDIEIPDNCIPNITIDEYKLNKKVGKEISEIFKNNLSNTSHADQPFSPIYSNIDEYAQSNTDSFDSDFEPRHIARFNPDTVNCDINTKDHEISKILREFIATEETYVETLNIGVRNYFSIFDRPDLPPAFNGKKFVLFGNIEEIIEFHEMEFLPMLRRNQHNIEKFCNEFCKFLEEDYFYCYELYSINKKRADNLWMDHKEYFLQIENNIEDKLGIHILLIQPIQRLTKYKLLLKEIKNYFKTKDSKYITLLRASCKVEKIVSNLCQRVTESVLIHDIKDCFEINLFYQGRFKKCNEFYVYDHSLRREYKAMAFIFDKSFVYTEILKTDKNQIFQYRGYYSNRWIGYLAGENKSFTLYRQNRKVQECQFSADQEVLELWLRLIIDMTQSFVNEEKEKLRKKYLNGNEAFRRPGSISVLRHSSRFSNASRKGSIIGSFPVTSNENSPRTSWNMINKKNRHSTTSKTSYSYEDYEDAYLSSDSFDSDYEPHTYEYVDQFGPDTSNYDTYAEDYEDVPQILRELILTEENYVNTLKTGIRNYFGIFDRPDLPPTLNGKKFMLFGNIEQIAEFHEMEFLPMLRRNRHDIEKLCNEFCKFVEEDYFYYYTLYSINKRLSDRLWKRQKEYFLKIENDIGDKLGIPSLLVQPIQRLPRYEMLLKEMKKNWIKTDDLKYKTLVPACYKVEKNVTDLCKTVNDSVRINDIKDCFQINLFYQGRFKKCDKFYVYDYTLRRGYKSMAFFFDKCFIYTEIIKTEKGSILQYRGNYPSDRIGIETGKKSFTLYYQKRKVQECKFKADQKILEVWLELITGMIQTFVTEEKEKLRKKHLKGEGVFQSPGNIYSLRHPSRLSNDSGIESVFSRLSVSSNEYSPRTTWVEDTKK